MKFCFFLEGLCIRVCMCIYIKKKKRHIYTLCITNTVSTALLGHLYKRKGKIN